MNWLICALAIVGLIMAIIPSPPRSIPTADPRLQQVQNQIKVSISKDGSLWSTGKSEKIDVLTEATITNLSEYTVIGNVKVSSLAKDNFHIGSTVIEIPRLAPQGSVTIPFKILSTYPGPKVLDHFQTDVKLTKIE